MSLVLNDVAKFMTSKIEVSEINETNYISTENMISNKGGITIASSLPDTKSVRKYLPKDILINNIRPYFKKIWYSDMEGGCSNDVFVIRSKENYDSKFLYYVLSSDDFFSYVMANAKGTKMPRGDKKAIQNYEVPNFSIDEQKRISFVLGEIDKKIEINKKINQNLLSIADAIYKNEFQNFDSYPEEELIMSDFGLIPKNWYYKTLDEISDVAIGKTPPRKETLWFSEKEGVKWVSIKDLGNSGTYIFETSEYLTEEAIEKFNVKLIPEDTVILSFKLTVGRLGITTEEMVTNEAIAHFKLGENSEITKEYLYLYLKNFNYEELGSTSSIAKAINSKIVKKIPILIPNDKIYELKELFENIFNEIKSNQLEINNLTKLRDTLLPKLMSGEIDVTKINYDLKNMINNFNIISLNLFNKGINMKTKIISKIQNQMKPYLNQGQYIKLTNSLLNSLQDIDIIDNNNDLSEVDNLKLLKLFLSAKEVEGCSEKTILYYKSTIEKMLMKIKKQVYNINTDDLRKYLYDYKYGNKSSKTTIDNIRRIFSSFFAWLEEEDYIIKNPVRRIHRVKTGRVVKETLTDENLEVLRDNCEEIRDLAIVELLISTGIRVGELVRLNINDVDFYERECIVFGKGESERVVYFDARTKIHLIEYLQSRVDENPALFVSLNEPYNRLGISGVETRLRELGKKCNINKVHPHKFRRTMATNAIDKGMPIEQVQRLLGHLQIDTTMQYAMVNQSNVKLAHRKFIG